MAEQEESSDNKPMKLSLGLSEPVIVPTTLGLFKARHVGMGDLTTFATHIERVEIATDIEREDLGRLALLTLVTSAGVDETPTALTEEMLSRLSPSDVSLLVNAIAQACKLESTTNIGTMEQLGTTLGVYLAKTAKSIAETSARIRKNIDSSFTSLSQTLKFTLGEQFSDLTAARNALGRSSAVGAAQRAFQAQNATVSNSSSSSGFNIPFPTSRPTLPPVPNLDAFRPPKFEETTAGRTAARAASASEESARQLNEVAGLIGTMAEQMADLQTVFLSRVLPEWFNNLESSADATSKTLRQAERSLFWAKWALVASVAVTIGMTAWQLWQTAQYEAANDKQQARSELLMKQQLHALQELNKLLMKRAPQADLPQSIENPEHTAPLRASADNNKKLSKTNALNYN